MSDLALGEDLPVFEVPLFDDQHAPLDPHPTRGAPLRQWYPRQLKEVTILARTKSTGHIRIIEEVRSADAQYSLLMHYYKVIGMVEVSKRRPPMTIEEEVTAYNLFQSGASIQEVAARLDKNISTIWRLAPGEPTRKYHHLHRCQIEEIDRLYGMKTPPKEIARVLNLPYRTVTYHLYEKKRHHLHTHQKQEIDRLHRMRTPLEKIARVLNLPRKTVECYLLERNGKELEEGRGKPPLLPGAGIAGGKTN
ncbi:hypothetical protein ANME2D_00707 [Candidatus Methanoperedens nitroreducens]|uniref:Uncharacterized protein n=1 Tax=Candidatus Methanoperedens nitratireducens TaxID=1392998 RepID=A0A062VEL0_9EURY|nr:hypothetical protein [Candidatus Methanoperedens nitroreducens]KCZ73635.1 hypothetical protein ANME2D_00707 [Candidatus Methanoperedens nitroreducens]MDJ1422407.1 hypothetical protein [Candidatus Methanoperedens sp.]